MANEAGVTVQSCSRAAVLGLVASVGLIGSLGCDQGLNDEADPVGRAEAPLINGEADDVEPYRFPMVGGIPGCSATLITPSHVLTAAHCVAMGMVPPPDSPHNRVGFQPNFGAHGPASVGIVGCSMSPGFTTTARLYRGWVPNSNPIGVLGDNCHVFESGTGITEGQVHEDYAVLTLERPVPHPISPLVVATAGAGSFFTRVAPVAEAPGAGPFEVIIVARGPGPGFSESGLRRFEPTTATRTAFLSFRDGAFTWPGDSGGALLYGPPGEETILALNSNGKRADVSRDEARLRILAWTDRNADGRPDIYCPGLPPRGSNRAANADNDRDGDGYLDDEDNFPGTYNPCQDPMDSDGDLIPDDVDACRGDPSITAPRGTLPDEDGDGFPDECDCAPSAADSRDVDHDFVSDSCDNCARWLALPGGSSITTETVYNPDQADADLDGVGDACDNCPAPANADQRDTDRDGVGNVCDDCPTVSDPLQPNCNADAEEVAHVRRRGDACDPQPCPETRPDTTRRSDGLYTTITTDVLLTDALAAEPLQARASSRWCTCSVAMRNDVDARRACRVAITSDGSGSCAVARASAYESIDAADRGAWQLPAIGMDGTGDTVVPPGGLPTEFVRTFDYPAPVLVDARLEDHRVFIVDARTFWDSTRDASLYGLAYQPFRGVMWTHAAGPRGSFTFFPTTANDPADPDPMAPAVTSSSTLSSHYWAGEVVPPVVVRRPFPCMPPSLPLLLDGPGFPLGASLGSAPWLVGQGALSRGNCRYDRFSDLLPFVGEGTFPVPFEVVPGLRPELFSIADRWIAAAEPGPWLPSVGVRYAAFDPAAQVLTRTLATGASGMLGIVPRTPPNCQQGNCGNLPPPPTDGLPLLALAAATPVVTAPARTGPLLVLSARRRTLYYGGGMLADGTLPGDLFAIDAVTGSKRLVPLPVSLALGRVLAATYSPADGMLYVLDEPARAPRRRERREYRTARLVRIAPDSGSADVLLETERSRDDRFEHGSVWALAPGSDGSLYLVAGADERHVVVRLLVTESGLRAEGLATGRGTLAAGQARGTASGLTVMTIDRLDRPRAIDYDASRLPTPPHRWDRLCF